MSSEIWKIGQETNAQSLYNDVKENGLNKCFFLRGEVVAVNALTRHCMAMTEAFNEVLDDQNEYLLDLEQDGLDLQNLKDDIDEKIKQLYNEIKALEQKEQDGSITEEEKQDLESKKNELHTLMNDSDAQLDEKTKKITEKGDKNISESKSKIAVAKDYGEFTVEKGTPLAETHVSSGFFKKLFGTTGKNKKEAGERAVEAGNNLLDKVAESTEISENIDTQYKKIKN